MDFVTDLPPSRDEEGRVFDSLFIVVDRYIKMTKYILMLKTIIIKRLANVFIKYVIS